MTPRTAPDFVATAAMSAEPALPDSLRIDLGGWLSDFELDARSRGRTAYENGQVVYLEIASGPPEATIRATVHSSAAFACLLVHRPGESWSGQCTCRAVAACQHLYAAGTALLHRLATNRAFEEIVPPSPRSSSVPADEAALVAQFTSANGTAPARKQLAWLRNLLRVYHSVAARSPYPDFQALQHLLPDSHRYGVFGYYDHPFNDRWSRPPATPLEFWSHLALILLERNVPLPPFMAKLTDLEWARKALAEHRLARELAVWRQRFAVLEHTLAETPAAPPALRSLRLRLGAKKSVWEISAPAPGGVPGRYEPFPGNELRELLYDREEATGSLAPASLALVALLASHLGRSNRLTFKLTEPTDRESLGRVLAHPLARDCIVDDAGRPLVRDPRRLVWKIADHPELPDHALARLAFADGTPAPEPLLHLGGQPALYLHGTVLFAGLPPPDPAAAGPVTIPRAALALPEAGRFAARAGVALPGDAAGRIRRESLRARLRARLVPRDPAGDPSDEVLAVELAALAPDGTPRAVYDAQNWRRFGPDLPPPGPDDEFLVLDFAPAQAAAGHFATLPLVRRFAGAGGPHTYAEIAPARFPETFSAWLAGFPPDTVVELGPELAAFAQAPTRAHFTLDVAPGDETGIDWFDVRVTLRAEDTTLTPAELALLQAAGGRFVRLTGRGWHRLALDDWSATQEKLARLGLDPAAAAEAGREPQRFHALQLGDEALRDALPEKLWAQVRDRAASLRATPAPALPAGLVADLRPYQLEGFRFLAFLADNKFGGILADDMGLGKTLQTLAWLLWLADQKPKLPTSTSTGGGTAARPFRVLVVCPKSVVVNWQLETARFAPALATTAFTSSLISPAASSPSGSQPSALNSQLLIANYAQLRLHAEALASVAWDAVILDEGQNIKNPASATAQAARALRAAHRLVLTGTPVENRLLDLWSLFAFAQPGLLGGQTAFRRLYNDKTDAPGARTRLAARAKHFLLRRTKSQVARDLPPRIEEELVVELEGPQRTLYDAELKRTRALLLDVKGARDFDRQRFNILQSLLRLRQICCDPRLVGVGALPKPPRRKTAAAKSAAPSSAVGSDTTDAAAPEPAAEPPPPPPSAKLEALLDALEPLVAEGHKVLVFSQFVTMLELIRAELVARSIGHLMLTGQTENRQDLVDQFQSDPALTVFLLSLKAAGSGLNLTAASYVVLFDPWWNPAVEAQAIDRTHRIGQKNQVIAYRLIARDTVEEKIRALQREKAALAAAVVQEESLAAVLDLDSLRRILA